MKTKVVVFVVIVALIGLGVALVGLDSAKSLRASAQSPFSAYASSWKLASDSSAANSVVRHVDGVAIQKKLFDRWKASMVLMSSLKGGAAPTDAQVWNRLIRDTVLMQSASAAGFTVTVEEARKEVDVAHQEYLSNLNAKVGHYTTKQFQKLIENAMGISDSAYWNTFMVQMDQESMLIRKYQTHWWRQYASTHPQATWVEIQDAWNTFVQNITDRAMMTR